MPEQTTAPPKDVYKDMGSGPMKTIMLDDTHIIQIQRRRSERQRDGKIFAGVHVAQIGGFRPVSIEMPYNVDAVALAAFVIGLAECYTIPMESLANALDEAHEKPRKK